MRNEVVYKVYLLQLKNPRTNGVNPWTPGWRTKSPDCPGNPWTVSRYARSEQGVIQACWARLQAHIS